MENTFLMVKEPGSGFHVPVHQDGINDRLVLDPQRAAAAWLAITPAYVTNGGLEVVPCSHRDGYLPYGRSDAPGQPLGVLGDGGELGFVAVELAIGEAVLMDVRLLHRSGPNRTTADRIGLDVRYVYTAIGVPLENVTVTHWRRDS